MAISTASVGGIDRVDDELDRRDAEFRENLSEIGPRLGHELVGKEIAVAVDDGESGRFGDGAGHFGFLIVNGRKNFSSTAMDLATHFKYT